MQRPATVRAVAFFDGQNLFRSARRCFGLDYPEFDYGKIAEEALRSSSVLGPLQQSAQLVESRLYTGVHAQSYEPLKARYWQIKLAKFGQSATATTKHIVVSRTLRYHDDIPREKGIDVRIALDLLWSAIEGQYDAAIIFSQDKDLNEAIEDVQRLARRDRRWIHIDTAFPVSATGVSCVKDEPIDKTGLGNSAWTKLDQAAFDRCKESVDGVALAAEGLLKGPDGRRFIDELLDAAYFFKKRNGYLGTHYFCHKWQLKRVGNPRPSWVRGMLEAAQICGLVALSHDPTARDSVVNVDASHPLATGGP